MLKRESKGEKVESQVGYSIVDGVEVPLPCCWICVFGRNMMEYQMGSEQICATICNLLPEPVLVAAALQDGEPDVKESPLFHYCGHIEWQNDEGESFGYETANRLWDAATSNPEQYSEFEDDSE